MEGFPSRSLSKKGDPHVEHVKKDYHRRTNLCA